MSALPLRPVGTESLSISRGSNISKLPIDSSKFFFHFKGYCSEFLLRKYTTVRNNPRRTRNMMHPSSIKAMIPPWSRPLFCGSSLCVVELRLSTNAVDRLFSWFGDFLFCPWTQQSVDSETHVNNLRKVLPDCPEPINSRQSIHTHSCFNPNWRISPSLAKPNTIC